MYYLVCKANQCPLHFSFYRVANSALPRYFLALMCLQVWPEVTITRGFPSYLPPLTFVLSVSAIKDALEDYRRHIADAEENERVVLVKQRSGEFVPRMWRNVVVGDVVKLLNR